MLWAPTTNGKDNKDKDKSRQIVAAGSEGGSRALSVTKPHMKRKGKGAERVCPLCELTNEDRPTI